MNRRAFLATLGAALAACWGPWRTGNVQETYRPPEPEVDIHRMMVESKARMRDEVYPYADRPNVSAEEIGRWQRDMGLRFNVGDDEFIADVNGVYRVEKTA